MQGWPRKQEVFPPDRDVRELGERAKPAANFNIQALRALAAYAVVGHHIIDALRNYVAIGRFTADPHFGATGVNLFFVISGYIMMATTARRPVGSVAFLAHRIIRVVPLYWSLTALAIAITAAGFALFGHAGLSVDRILRSFLFFPEFEESGKVSAPILFVGWTLNYEMMFYLLFALCLLARRAQLLLGCVAIGALWVAQLAKTNAYLTYWGNDVILAFAFGMALWKLSALLPLRFPLAWTSILAGLVAMALPDLIPELGSARHATLVPDIGAALIVYGTLSLESWGYSVGDGFLKRQGDASYSLYLLHPFILQSLGKIWLKLHLNASVAGLIAMVPIMLVVSGALATGLHRVIERPLTDRLRRRVDRKNASLPTVP